MLELKGPTPSVGADLGKGDKMHTIIRGNMGNLGKPKSSSSQKSSWAMLTGNHVARYTAPKC